MNPILTRSIHLSILISFVFCSAACSAPDTKAKKTKPAAFSLHSFALENMGVIPKKYASSGISGGENISIPLFWSLTPKQTKSFALAMTDSSANNAPHWMVANIPAGTMNLEEGASMTSMPENCFELINGFGSIGYAGPEPQLWSGKHTYVITLYALSTQSIKLKRDANYQDFLAAISKNIISSTSLTGTFSRF